MSLSLFVPRALACLYLAVMVPSLARAQVTYPASNGEYSIAGALPGEQTLPQMSVGAAGGYLVWQDNGVDGSGLGIRAVALDSNFLRVGAPFRVNVVGAEDQERPQVSLLKDGGAVFVWQGGKLGFQKVFARFLSPSNTWITPDILVSTNRTLAMPVVTTLANGNVVVAWASFNQRSGNSYHDVYAKILTPDGHVIGGEIPVNQFSAYNQRTPALAALPEGGFVVAWMSEQQRNAVDNPDSNFIFSSTNQSSVDIVARVFDQNGMPVASEFLVNGDGTMCVNPSVAVNASGGYLIAWTERAYQVATNWMDISARAFSSSGLGGTVRKVNTHVRGDQYAPQVKAARDDYFVVWTSLAQDGSFQGIFGRFLAADGAPAGSEFGVNTTVVHRQLHPTVGADPDGRFLAVWASYVGGPQSLDLKAQKYVASDYTPITTVTNYYGPVSDPWATNNGTGGAIVGTPRLEFPTSSTPSEALPNGLKLAQGSYKGLFYDTNGVSAGSSGYFSLVTTAAGSYSGQLVLNNVPYYISGKFNATGKAVKKIIRLNAKPIVVQMSLDLGGGNQVRGTVTCGSWTAGLIADRRVYTLSNPCPFAGAYNMIIPPADGGDLTSPAGFGIGAVKIDKLGIVTWSGTLADGTKVSRGSAVSDQGFWPLYGAPYLGKGLNLSWVEMATNNLGGQFVWIKPAKIPGVYYPRGFTNELSISGARYASPPTGTRALGWPSALGQLVFKGGGLGQGFTNSILLDPNNRVFNLDGRRMDVTISLPTGWFYGNAREPGTGKLLPFQGRLLQNSGTGVGFFRSNNKSGEMRLEPVALP